MHSPVRVCLATVVALSLLGRGAPVRAAEPTTAEALFREARELLAKGEIEAACPKLEESQRLDPAPGTEFNLARCYELTGRLASAWGAYADVAAITHTAGQSEREARARERVTAIEPRLSFVIVKKSERAGELQLTCDGKPMAPAELDVAIPIDPGPHVIRASAPSKKGWETAFRIDADAQRVTIAVPALDDAPPEIAAPEPAVSSWGTQRTAAVAVLGAGLVAGGIGTYFGLRKVSLASEARGHCDAGICDEQGASAIHDSLFAGDASTVSFLACGALAVTGGVLWFTAPKPAARGVRVTPGVTASSASILIQGRWE